MHLCLTAVEHHSWPWCRFFTEVTQPLPGCSAERSLTTASRIFHWLGVFTGRLWCRSFSLVPGLDTLRHLGPDEHRLTAEACGSELIDVPHFKIGIVVGSTAYLLVFDIAKKWKEE